MTPTDRKQHERAGAPPAAEATKVGSVRMRVLVPTSLVIVGLLLGFWVTLSVTGTTATIEESAEEFGRVPVAFQAELAREASLMDAAMESMVRDASLRSSMVAGDIKSLLRLTQPLFERLREKHRITHCYFIGPDRVCLLRVHQPKRRGEKIDRFTALQAEESGDTAWGIELGPLGTFTLRVVRPWRVEGRLIGYIELGMETDHLIENLRKSLGLEFCVAIHKKYLDRQLWEEGMRMLGRDGKWDLHPSSVIVDQTLETIPRDIINHVGEGDHDHEVPHLELSMGDRDYHAVFHELKDAEDREVGDLVIFHDVTAESAGLRETLVMVAIVCVVLGGGLFTFFWVYLGQVEHALTQSAIALRETNESLQREVVVRRRAEKALTHSNRELTLMTNRLEEVNRELTDFVYVASHDLREPLRKISSFGSLLKEALKGKLEADDQENLDYMTDGADRMTQMIDDLLVYSRINTKEALLETVDCNEIVERLKQIGLAALLEESDATIEVPQPLPKLKANIGQITQLLQNLIANGIKYRREEVPPRVVITARQLDNDMVRVEVRDNGIGISEEHHEDIFKMFRRLHSRRKYEGTGIGLAVCKRIVDRHGGQIGLESTEGEGSTFWFALSSAEQAPAMNEPVAAS